MLTPSIREPTRWIWISRDATKHRQHDEALQVSRLVLEWSPLPIAVVDSQYRYRYVSPIFQMMQGLSDREIVEKSVADIWGL